MQLFGTVTPTSVGGGSAIVEFLVPDVDATFEELKAVVTDHLGHVATGPVITTLRAAASTRALAPTVFADNPAYGAPSSAFPISACRARTSAARFRRWSESATLSCTRPGMRFSNRPRHPGGNEKSQP